MPASSSGQDAGDADDLVDRRQDADDVAELRRAECAGAAELRRRRADARSAGAGRLARRRARSTTTWVTGSANRSRVDSTMPRSSQFERPSGCVEMISSSGAKMRIPSSIASSGSPSPIWPRASISAVVHRGERGVEPVLRRDARLVLVRDPVPELACSAPGRRRTPARALPSTRCLIAVEELLAADGLVRDHEDPVLAVVVRRRRLRDRRARAGRA